MTTTKGEDRVAEGVDALGGSLEVHRSLLRSDRPE